MRVKTLTQKTKKHKRGMNVKTTNKTRNVKDERKKLRKKQQDEKILRKTRKENSNEAHNEK